MEGPSSQPPGTASPASSTSGGRHRRNRRFRPSERKGKNKEVVATGETTRVDGTSNDDRDTVDQNDVRIPSEELEFVRQRELKRQQKLFASMKKPPKVVVNPDALQEVLNIEERKPIKPTTKAYWDTQEFEPGPDEFAEAAQSSDAALPSSSPAPPRANRSRHHRDTEHHHGSRGNTLGAKPKGPRPNQGGLSRVVAQRQFGAQLTNDVDEGSSQSLGSTVAARNRKGKQPERSFAESNGVSSQSNGQLRADAPTFEPGNAAASLPPHLRTAGRSKNYPADYVPGTSSKKQAPPTQPARQSGPQRTRAGPSHQKNRAPKEKSFEKTDPQGMQFPVVKKFRPQTNTSNGPEDMMTRIHKEIGSGLYECMVCYGAVSRQAKIWSCKCCWSVFHLKCIQKWAKQGLQQKPTGPIGADGPPKPNWRCPGCNNSNEETPSLYTCWCEKSIQPEASKFLPPHSCGQTCGKKRIAPKGCPHACDLQCHAGPCPPCTAVGPSKSCFCGKQSSQRRCVDTDYENGWSCGQICEDFMPCGEHTCPQPCHSGLCGACEVTDILRCYCGRTMREVKCCDKEEPLMSSAKEEDGDGVDEWEGYFECREKCERPFDCGIHFCGKPCHTQELESSHCPLSPDVVTHCRCGKTPLTELLDSPRENCDASIPHCTKTCEKPLKCGHKCTKKCHEGDCSTCLERVEVACRCGKTVVSSLCHQGMETEPPQCMRTCRTLLSCGRHECQERCCSGEKKAQERLSAKKKMRPFSAGTPALDGDFEPEHICTRPCGKLLKCGLHNCQSLCHRGPCGSCLEASFDELTCHCGKTVVDPPVPCGTKPPNCHHQCNREKTCGHPVIPHECHTDEQNCPPCSYLTEKPCVCGKKNVKAVPCYRDTVSCGTECGKKLSCGTHTCKKICSLTCDEPCTQKCGKPKSCGHPCTEACHAPFQCSEDRPCAAKIKITCECGGIAQDVKCGASKSNPTGNRKELKCSDQCRSRRLALALELDPDREGIPPYSDDTVATYNDYNLKEKKWALNTESEFRQFAASSSQVRLQFTPMEKRKRSFLHSLAADYNLESESQDPEPYRSVVVRKTAKFVAAPRKTLSEYMATLKAPVAAAAPVALQQLKKPRQQAVNAYVLQGTRIGLLHADVLKELSPVLSQSQLRFEVGWYGDESVLLQSKPSSLAMDQVESELQNLLPTLKRAVASKGLANSVELCWVGRDGKIASRESEGWSVVASKKAVTPVPSTSNVSSRNAFDLFNTSGNTASPSVPSKKSTESIKKTQEVVVDDWEMAAEESDDDLPIS